MTTQVVGVISLRHHASFYRVRTTYILRGKGKKGLKNDRVTPAYAVGCPDERGYSKTETQNNIHERNDILLIQLARIK